MEIDELTPNGIERFLKGETVIVQLLNTGIYRRENDGGVLQLVTATISDGYAYFKSVYLFLDSFSNQNTENNIVKLRLVESTVKKISEGKQVGKSPLFTDAHQFVVVSNKINRKIGNPVSFQQYIKAGKKNLKGDRKFRTTSYKQDEQTQEDAFLQAQRQQQRIKQKKKNQNIKQKQNGKIVKQNQARQTSNSKSMSNAVSNQVKGVSAPKQHEPPKKNPQVQSKPIQKISPPKMNRPSQRSIKPQVKHHESDHQKIRQLFLGMENFKILARLMFIWPVKVFTNKKGNQSELLNLEFGDESGTIMCTVFGDNTNRYSTLLVDMVYSITGATIIQSSYKGVTELKLTFNQSTKVNLQQNNPSLIKHVPKLQKFCISLKQLNQSQRGRIATVICMVKQGQLVQFVSRNGNRMKKKVLQMYDIENQLQCGLTLFNQNAELEYVTGMYALKGVQVDQYQGAKQFKGNVIFIGRLLKNHPMNKKINEIQELNFTSIGSNNKKPKGQLINSFSAINQKSLQLKLGQNLWSQVICYLKAIRIGGNSKNIYLSCPLCRKKLTQQTAQQCHHCKKVINKPMYRYILNINLIDDHDNIWVNVYDEVGKELLALPSEKEFTADQFADCTEDNIRKRVQEIRYKQIKASIATTKQQFNGEVRVKHKIIKLVPIVFQQQSRNLLQKIKSAIGAM